MNKNNTYISLYHAAQFVLKNTSARVKEIVLEIKNKEQSRHFHDIATLKDELVQKLKRAISEQRAAAFSQTMAVENDLKGLLNENEKFAYLKEIDDLSSDQLLNLKIRVAKYPQRSFFAVHPYQALAAPRIHVLPADFDERRRRRQNQYAQVIMNIKKEHLNSLIKFSPQLFLQHAMPWVEQIIFSGTDCVGLGQGDVVMVLSEANISYAQQLKDYLTRCLGKDIFVDVTPLRTYQLAPGVAYAEIRSEKEMPLNTPPFSVKNIAARDEEDIACVVSKALLTGESLEDVLLNPEYWASDEKTITKNDVLLGASLKKALSHCEDDRAASAAIQQFLTSPDQFITTNSVTTEALLDEDISYRPARRFAKFVEIASNQYEIVSVNRMEKNTIDAYFLDFKGIKKTDIVQAWIDIPKEATGPCFLFTAPLKGASLIVTDLNATTYRVYRDQRNNSSSFYEKVVMAIDAVDYTPAIFVDGAANAMMYYVGGKWQLMMQRQFYSSTTSNDAHLHKTPWVQTIDVHTTSFSKTSSSPIVRTRRGLDDDLLYNHRDLQNAIKKHSLSRQDLIHAVRQMHHSIGFTGRSMSLGINQITNISTSASTKTLTTNISSKNSVVQEHDVYRQDLHQYIDSKLAQLNKKKQQALQRSNTVRRYRQGIEEKKVNEYSVLSEYYQNLKNLLSKSKQADDAWLKQNSNQNVINLSVTSTSESDTLTPRPTINLDYQRKKITVIFDDGFDRGYDSFEDINIPGYVSDMTFSELQELFANQLLTSEQYGALEHRIVKKRKQENVDLAFSLLDKISDMMSHTLLPLERSSGEWEILQLPQSLYALIMEDQGRCLPLTLLMATALSKGSDGVANFIKKFNDALSNPRGKNALLLKESLRNMHGISLEGVWEDISNLPEFKVKDPNDQLKVVKLGEEIYIEDKSVMIFSIKEIVDLIKNADTEVLLAMNTATHSMLIGVTFSVETEILPSGLHASQRKRKIHFFDPNTGLFTFEKTKDLQVALDDYLLNLGLAKIYKSYGKKENPQFRVKRIDAKAAGQIMLASQLKLSDFSRAQTLSETVKDKVEAAHLFNQLLNSETARPSTHPESYLESQQQARSYSDAEARIREQYALQSEWLLPLSEIRSSADQIDTHGQYELSYVNKENGQQRKIYTNDNTFLNFKNYAEGVLEGFHGRYSLNNEKAEFVQNTEIEEQNVDGLSEAFLLQSVIESFKADHREKAGDDTVSSNLKNVLILHGYLTKLQMTQGVTHDAVKIASLFRELQAGGAAPISVYGSALGKVSGGVGIVLNGAAIVADVYELAHAENDIQKAIFTTQLVADSSGLVLNGAAICASLLGASTAATVLGGVGVIAGGLSVGAFALAQNYEVLAEEAKELAICFDKIKKAYAAGGYTYDAGKGILSARSGAVIKAIDFKRKQLTLGNAYLYASEYGLGYVYYPSVIKDKVAAINLRTNYSGAETASFFAPGNLIATVLPSQPTYYLSFNQYVMTLSVLRDSGSEFEAIDELERKNPETVKFQHKFFPYKRTVSKILCEYDATNVDIILDDGDHQLLVPDLPIQQHGYLLYHLKNGGGRVVVDLNEGVKFNLSLQDVERCGNFMLRTKQLKSDVIEIFEDRLQVGGVNISVDLAVRDNIFVSNHRGEISKVDFANKKTIISSVDAPQWQERAGMTQQTISEYLSALATKQSLSAEYILVSNYVDEQRNVGDAYYDVKNKRMLFSLFGNVSSEKINKINTLFKAAKESNLLEVAATKKEYGILQFGDKVGDVSSCELKETFSSTQLTKLEEWLNCWRTVGLSDSAIHALNALIIQLKGKLSAWSAVLPIKSRFYIPRTKWEKLSAQEKRTFFPDDEDRGKKVVGLDELSAWIPEKNNHIANEIRQSFSMLNNEIGALDVRLARLTRIAELGDGAELGGVVGDVAYFYHRKKNFVWCVDINTKQVVANFYPMFDDKEIQLQKVWQVGSEIYLSYQCQMDGVECYALHQIKDLSMTLVHVTSTTPLAINDSVEKRVNKLTQLCKASDQKSMHELSDTFPDLTGEKIVAVPAAFVGVSQKNQQGVEQYDWWRYTDGKVVQLNRSALSACIAQVNQKYQAHLTFPLDLVLTGADQLTPTQEVFYFYSRAQQMIYQQAEENSVVTIQAVIIPKLLDFRFVEPGFFATTEDGFIERLEVTGRYHLEGVNTTWLRQHKNWIRDLAFLEHAHSFFSLGLYGVFDSKNKNLVPMWYSQGRVIVAAKSLYGSALQFLGLSADKQSARLFDTQKNKLYAQPLVDITRLTTAFNATCVFEQEALVPAASQLFPEQTFKSATYYGGVARLTTSAGEVVEIDASERLKLIGVDAEWEIQHPQQAMALDALSKKWALQNAFKFVRGADNKLHVAELPVGHHLGAKPKLSMQKIGDKILSIQGSDQADTLVPLRQQGIETVLLAGKEGPDTYQIGRGWGYYRQIIIDNHDALQSTDHLCLSVMDFDKVMLVRKGNNLQLLDGHNTTLILNNVYSKQASNYRHLQIHINDSKKDIKTSVDNIIEKLELYSDADVSEQEPINFVTQIEHLVQVMSAEVTMAAESGSFNQIDPCGVVPKLAAAH